MPVRDDGITLVSGGSGPGSNVSVVGPLGSQPAASSVSVAIASDQLPLPVSASVAPTTRDATGTLNVVNDFVELDVSDLGGVAIYLDSFGLSIPAIFQATVDGTNWEFIGLSRYDEPTNRFDMVSAATFGLFSGPVAGYEKIRVFADNAAFAGPLTVTIHGVSIDRPDGETNVAVTGDVNVTAIDLDIRNLVFATDKVDATGSVISGTVTASPVANIVTVTTSNTPGGIFIPVAFPAGYNSVTVEVNPSGSWNGSIAFGTFEFDLVKFFDLKSSLWINSKTLNGSTSNVFSAPSNASGYQLTITNVSGTAVITVTVSTSIPVYQPPWADSTFDTESKTAPTGLQMAGWDRAANIAYQLPVLGPSFSQPAISTVAVPVLIRNGTETNNPSGGSFLSGTFLSVGGGTANSSTRPVRAVLSGNQFANASEESAQPYGWITREQGQQYANSGSINVIGQRFTVSSQFHAKASTLFRISETNPFIGTIKPVVSLDNGATWSFVLAINVLTGAIVSELNTGNFAGTYAIPAGNGATNYGWEITARTTGDLAFRVASNSQGIGALFALSVPFGNTPVSALVTDTSESYLPNENKQLSMANDGSLRVMNTPAPIPISSDLIPEVISGYPYQYNEMPSVW